MPNIQCLGCGRNIELDSETYVNYTGEAACQGTNCNNKQSIVIEDGLLTASSRLPRAYDFVYPLRNCEVPAEIMADFREATESFVASAYKASVVMCRRTVQHVLLNKKIADTSLNSMLDDALKRKVISSEVYQSATAIRKFGNSGAHPKDAELHIITNTQAEIVLHVTGDILREVYAPRKSFFE